jgi:outer membrane protein insertion porin family
MWTGWAPILLLLLLGTASLGQQDIITNIEIHGNRRIPTETIRARIYTRAGDVYDQASLDRDLHSLWNTSYFSDIRFEREQTPKGWIIHIYVTERPTVREIDYVGLNAVTKSDVLDRFKEAKVSLTPESQYDPTKVKKAEVVIKGLLAEHGRQYASIRTEIRQIPPAAVNVTFVIKEGPKVKVGKIRFVGNKNVSTRILRGAMKFSRPVGVPHSIFLESLFAKTYDASKLDQDMELVRDAYQNRGYFKAVVNDPKTEIHDTGHRGFHVPLFQSGGGKAVDITVPVEEGDLYHLGKITFKNNKAVTNLQILRAQFPIKDGAIFDRSKIAKGLENLREAYGSLGYINFTPVPEPTFDEDKKLVFLEIDEDEGKQFSVRRIEFTGNTTTRDKVIRREIVLQEGGVYNEKLWKISLLRLNQLNYFEPLKPDDPNVTDRHLNDKEGTVDLTLKLKEKGKNSIGLTGGVSGLSGSFIGLSYATNNLMGRGETLSVQANIGNLERDLTFGFTEPYLFDRSLEAGFTVYGRKFSYDQARYAAILSGVPINIPQSQLQNLQNYTQASKGFSLSVSHPLHHGGFKRLGLSYSFDVSSLVTLSDASKNLFNYLEYEGISGPNSLNGITTSKIVPSFSSNTVDNQFNAHSGTGLTLAAELAGLGGTVRSIRPIVQYKHFIPVQKHRNSLGFNLQGSFLTGYGGVVAPPFERNYLGGEYDIRGFDIRSVSPVAFLPNIGAITLVNPDGTPVPKDPTNPLRGNYTIPIPIQQIVFPGGDASLIGNFSYNITIAGPVVLAPFVDAGIDPIVRESQLRITPQQTALLNSTAFGCPALDAGLNCTGTQFQKFSQFLKPVSQSNWTPRMSTGLELRVMLPIVNAPFRIYWAYNPMRLNTTASGAGPITRSMFPAGAAGDYTYQQAIATYSSKFLLREPLKTFRFTVGTSF